MAKKKREEGDEKGQAENGYSFGVKKQKNVVVTKDREW